MKSIIRFTLMALLLSSAGSFAQGPGEAAVPFLLISPGARAGGMGETGAATSTDVTAIVWNPAGLAFQYEKPETDSRGEVSLMHSKWLPQFNFLDWFYDLLVARCFTYDGGMCGSKFPLF